MTKTWPASLTLLIALLTPACAIDRPASAPLPLGTVAAPRLASSAASLSIDLTQPLTPDSIAMIAVYTNPDLKALRAGEGVAEAQLFAAGLLPDPAFSFGADAPLNGTGLVTALAGSLGLDFAVLARRPGLVRGARSNLDQVRLDILWSEWLTAEQARLAALRITRLQAIRQMTTVLRQHADSAMTRVLAAAQRGDLPAAQVETYRLAASDAAARDRDVERRLRAAELDLNRLLGIDPTETVRLSAGSGPRKDLPGAAQIFARAVDSRTDLTAFRAAYQGAEANLDLAQLSRFPFPSVTVNAARDTGALRTLGPSVSFNIPLFNRGRGEVAVSGATLERVRAEYLARIEAVRAEIYSAHSALMLARQQGSELERETAALLPMADAAEQAAMRGDLPLSVALATRMTALDKQIVAAELELSAEELELGLEILSGQRLDTPQ
ncbi:TolC family protein [uncultured Maricaulis sp.]|uniref:TolC family protein n=1 Tax=uncultured Maricaulis sp. TaxID=174710 RepID=UPI0030D971E2